MKRPNIFELDYVYNKTIRQSFKYLAFFHYEFEGLEFSAARLYN